MQLCYFSILIPMLTIYDNLSSSFFSFFLGHSFIYYHLKKQSIKMTKNEDGCMTSVETSVFALFPNFVIVANNRCSKLGQ